MNKINTLKTYTHIQQITNINAQSQNIQTYQDQTVTTSDQTAYLVLGFHITCSTTVSESTLKWEFY